MQSIEHIDTWKAQWHLVGSLQPGVAMLWVHRVPCIPNNQLFTCESETLVETALGLHLFDLFFSSVFAHSPSGLCHCMVDTEVL
jgi:hypothetical protein